MGIHIELLSLRSNGDDRVEHYGKECDEKCNLGLAKGHYFIHGYTGLTSLLRALRRNQSYQKV